MLTKFPRTGFCLRRFCLAGAIIFGDAKVSAVPSRLNLAGADSMAIAFRYFVTVLFGNIFVTGGFALRFV